MSNLTCFHGTESPLDLPIQLWKSQQSLDSLLERQPEERLLMLHYLWSQHRHVAYLDDMSPYTSHSEEDKQKIDQIHHPVKNKGLQSHKWQTAMDDIWERHTHLEQLYCFCEILCICKGLGNTSTCKIDQKQHGLQSHAFYPKTPLPTFMDQWNIKVNPES